MIVRKNIKDLEVDPGDQMNYLWEFYSKRLKWVKLQKDVLKLKKDMSLHNKKGSLNLHYYEHVIDSQ